MLLFQRPSDYKSCIMARKSKVYSILLDEEFKKLAYNCSSYSDMLRELGLTTNGGNSLLILKKRIKELNIDTSHFKSNNGNRSSVKYSLEEILVEDSKYQNRTSLKARLIKENLLEYKCKDCGIDSWREMPISLHLDHINGINNDNRITNLRLLCPNCHSQTETYSGKNTYRG